MSLLRYKVVSDQDFLRQPNQTFSTSINSVNNFHVQYSRFKFSFKPLKIGICISL